MKKIRDMTKHPYKRSYAEVRNEIRGLIEERYHVQIGKDPECMILIPKANPATEVGGFVLREVVTIDLEVMRPEVILADELTTVVVDAKDRMVRMFCRDFFETFLGKKETYLLFYKYDERTYHYLQAIKEGRGIVDYYVAYEPEEFEPIKSYAAFEVPLIFGPLEVGKTADDIYVAQYYLPVSADDDWDHHCYIHRMYFDHFPSEEDITAAQRVRNVEVHFKQHPHSHMYKCWKCGRKVHWLDIPAESFEERCEKLVQQDCGCWKAKKIWEVC